MNDGIHYRVHVGVHFHVILGLPLLALLVAPAVDPDPELAERVDSVEFVSDRLERIVEQRQSWGELGLDTCAHASGHAPLSLQIGEQHYTKGLGSHAQGEIVVALDGDYTWFDAAVGVQWQQGITGSVEFRVFVDDELRFESGVVREVDGAKPIRVSMAGADELRLVVTDAGDGITCDCADWAEARLTRAAEPALRPPRLAVNLAHFAAVRSWDPKQTSGTSAGRLDEFPAADLRPFTDLVPDAAGVWSVAVHDGVACIGLEWLERRRVARVELELATGIALSDVARLEWWAEGASGSTWQGRWQSLHGAIRVEGDRTIAELSPRENPELMAGTRKIRWLLPSAAGAVRVRSLAAFSRSRWREIELSLSMEPARPGSRATLTLYNGEVVGAATAATAISWSLAAPLRLPICYCATTRCKSDRTVLRIALPDQAFGVAVDDVLAHGAVWVGDAGLYVTDAAHPIALALHRERYAGLRTVLDEVGTRPDQTLDAAMAGLHDPVQEQGPTLLSLPADNRKFIVERTGTVRWDDRPEVVDCADHAPAEAYRCSATVRFGEPTEPPTERELADLTCLALELRGQSGAVRYTMRSLVAPLRAATGSSGENSTDGSAATSFNDLRREPVVGELLLTAENSGAVPAAASFQLEFGHPAGVVSAIARDGSARATITVDDAVLAWIDAERGTLVQPLGNRCTLRTPLLPGARTTCRVVLPRWNVRSAEPERVPDSTTLVENARGAWQPFLAEQTQIDVPDPLLDRLIDASIVHCLAAARAPAAGRIAPWIASMAYGPLESEAQSVVRGMQSLGMTSFAGPSLRWFADQIDPRGLLTTGYTTMGTGWYLWTLGEYGQLFEPTDWLREVAPDVVRACHWIMRERRKTMVVDASGSKVPEYGLMPPCALADWNVYAFYFYANANYCAGLREAAVALAMVGDANAAEIAADAEVYRKDLLRAFRWAAARAPVVALRDGSSVPYYPTHVYSHGPIEDLYPGEDAGRSWCYDVEAGAIHLIALGILDPHSSAADGMLQHLEDVQFLRDGWFAYPARENTKDAFLFGGFAKVQPYYARTVETYAGRDDVKAFVRSYCNTIPTLLNREDLSLWEHFHANGAWNKTHETGYFLQQTRTLLLTERGDELWLAPFVPANWLTDGKRISVRGAPTRFGPVSYVIRSHVVAANATNGVDGGFVEATIDPPARRSPARIVLRLRHPEGRPIRSVTIDGHADTQFDPAGGLIVLPASRLRTVIRVQF